jgi:hypothetical protein
MYMGVVVLGLKLWLGKRVVKLLENSRKFSDGVLRHLKPILKPRFNLGFHD